MEDDWNTDVDNQPHKDYYKVLEIDYDATDEDIRLSFRKLALKWHPDKHLGSNSVTSKFQDINEAYRVLSDPDMRGDYDVRRVYEIKRYTLREYLTRFKGMILTPNGLGMSQYGNTISIAFFSSFAGCRLVLLFKIAGSIQEAKSDSDEPNN